MLFRSAADKQHAWNINYAHVWQIWRAGCIIQADALSSTVLSPILLARSPDLNILHNARAMQDVQRTFPALRNVVARAVETDQVIPALGATLEFWKLVTGTDLPTSFYEAQLDYFGWHMFDKKGDEGVGGPTEGRHHFEWRPARSRAEVYGKGKGEASKL